MAKKGPLGFFIYALCEPGLGLAAVRYVGLTTQSFPERLQQHIYDARRGKGATYKVNWIRRVLASGGKPEIVHLETCHDESGMRSRERHWVAYYAALGTRLTNGTAGGEGVLNPTAEVRAKMSAKSYPQAIPVVDELGLVFASGASAEDFHGLKPGCVGYVINRRHNQQRACGRTFRIFEQGLDIEAWRREAAALLEMPRLSKGMLGKRKTEATKLKSRLAATSDRGVAVVDERGTQYSSFADASRALNVRPQNIYKIVHDREQCSSTKGHTFCLWSEDLDIERWKWTATRILARAKNNDQRARPVTDECGTSYPSVGAAARAIGTKPATVQKSCDGRRKSPIKGHTFRYLDTTTEATR